MGAQWKQAGREQNAAKRGQIVGRLAKEIAVAAKLGDPNPDNNARLRAAVEAAKKASVPKDTIERAIKKGAGLTDETINYELVTYEGFCPHKVPVIVECLTDNKNRTAAEVRVLFRKGQLGSIGSVSWMFERMGVVEASNTDSNLDLEAVAIEAGAQNVEPAVKEGDGISATFFCDATDLDTVSKFLTKAGWSVTTAELSYVPKNYTDVSEEQKKEISEFLNAIDDFDDVHRIYTAIR
ncbi:MAG: YebC/PmpR family DNA-binding transcriptional regulator [Bacteriovoracia bacterium]